MSSTHNPQGDGVIPISDFTDRVDNEKSIIVINDQPNPQLTEQPVEFYEDNPDDFTIATYLIPMLNNERKNEKYYWIAVGKALFNSCKGCGDGLKLWIDFTRGSRYYNEKACQKLYPSFWKDNHLTIKTIAWYAREDRRDLYDKWHQHWYNFAIDEAASLTHTDVANALYRIYWLEFIYSFRNDKSWYHYEDHRWKKVDVLIIRKEVSGDFLKLIETRRNQCDQLIQLYSTSDDKTRRTNKIDKLYECLYNLPKLIQKLKTIGYKNAIMSESRDHFYNESFSNFRDTNDKIMGVIDGVIEKYDGNKARRPGKPEDYITVYSQKDKLVEIHPEKYINDEVCSDEFDLYELFRDECIEPAIIPGSASDDNPDGVRDANERLTLAQVYAEFKVWHKDNYPETEAIKRDVVKYELEQRWGKLPRVGGWQGIRIKEQLASI